MTVIAPPPDYVPPSEDLLGAAYDAATDAGGSNGAMPWPRLFLDLAAAINHLAARGRSIPCSTVALSFSSTSDDNWATRWFYRYRSGQNGTQLEMRAACAPAGVAATAPAYSWDAGATPRRYDRRSSAPQEEDIVPVTGGLGEVVDAAVTRDTLISAYLSTNDNLRLCGLSLWETPRRSLDTATTDTLLDPGRFAGGRPVTDADIAALLAAYRDLYESGKHLVAHNVDDQATPHSRTLATLRNLHDQTVSAWSATSPGWPLDVYRCGANSLAAIPITVHAYVATTGTGTVRFETSLGGVNVAVAGGGTWYATTVNADPTIETEKLDVLFAGDGAAACRVWAVSAYAYFG